jgi:hypothetical protein
MTYEAKDGVQIHFNKISKGVAARNVNTFVLNKGNFKRG